jgi:hypothetical protein
MLYAAIDIHKHAFQAAVLDPESGEVVEERFSADRESLARWAETWRDRVAAVAIEATTGWRWVWRELAACGFEVRLAEPVQARGLLGRRRSAKTDRLDARWLALAAAEPGRHRVVAVPAVSDGAQFAALPAAALLERLEARVVAPAAVAVVGERVDALVVAQDRVVGAVAVARCGVLDLAQPAAACAAHARRREPRPHWAFAAAVSAAPDLTRAAADAGRVGRAVPVWDAAQSGRAEVEL